MSAKEMFEKLDYYLSSEENEEEIVYNQDLSHTSSFYRYISFNKKNKVIEMDDNSTEPFYIQIDELQAINKQVEELGLLEEMEE